MLIKNRYACTEHKKLTTTLLNKEICFLKKENKLICLYLIVFQFDSIYTGISIVK